jgi:hypothetical protein
VCCLTPAIKSCEYSEVARRFGCGCVTRDGSELCCSEGIDSILGRGTFSMLGSASSGARLRSSSIFSSMLLPTRRATLSKHAASCL